MFTNLSVSRKLAIAFAAVLLAIVAMGGVVFYNLQALDRAGVLRAEVNEAVRDTAFAELKVVRQENSMRGYLLSGDRYYLERLDVHRADFKKALSELKAVPGMDIASDVATVETAADEWFENVVVAGSALAANPETRAQAVAMIGREGSADVYIGKVEEALEAVKAINAEQIDVAVKAQAGAARTALLALIVGLIAATLIAIGAGLMVTRALIGPIQNLIGYMKRIMAGDLDVEVPCAQRKDEFGQFGGFAVQAQAGGGRLLDHGRVLLSDLIHLVHGGVDLGQTHRLLLSRRADFAHQGRDLFDPPRNAGQSLARLTHQNHPVLDLAGTGRDQRLDLLGRFRRTLRQGPHFGRDDGEATTGLARTGGLDPGVQGQEIGLEGDLVDHADDLADLVG